MGRAPAFGAQQGGFSQPGSAGTQLAPNYGPAQNQAALDQFEALTLGPAAPGQPGDTGKPSRWHKHDTSHHHCLLAAVLEQIRPVATGYAGLLVSS